MIYETIIKNYKCSEAQTVAKDWNHEDAVRRMVMKGKKDLQMHNLQ